MPIKKLETDSKEKKLNYEIIEHIGVLSDSGEWKKELNIVSWNGHPPKYDIRDWNHKEGKSRKGVTLTYEELVTLKGILD